MNSILIALASAATIAVPRLPYLTRPSSLAWWWLVGSGAVAWSRPRSSYRFKTYYYGGGPYYAYRGSPYYGGRPLRR